MHHIFCGQQMPAVFPVAAEIWISGKITIKIRYIYPDFLAILFNETTKESKKGRCTMSGDAELLNFIYQNSQMGVDTIRQLIGVVEEQRLKRTI